MIHKKLLSLLVLLMTTVSMSAKPANMQISVTMPTGNSITLEVFPNYTITEVKSIIHDQTLIPTELQILTFNNQVLEDTKYLSDYDIRNDAALTLSLVSGNYYLNGGSTQNCPVSFKVGNSDGVVTAQEDDVVTVTFTPTAPYVLTAVTSQAYTTWAGARRAEPESTPTIPMLGDITLTPVQGQANTYTFTMPPSHVKFNTTLLQEYEVDLTVNGDDDQGTEKALWTGKAGEQGTAKSFPITAKTGQTVTISYNGRRKVKAVTATTDAVPTYLKWDATKKKLVEAEIPATAKKVENAVDDVIWEAGTYLVEGNVTINGCVRLSGDVELIIKDGAKLTAKRIDGNYYYSLNVYGQANKSGELNVACSYDDAISELSVLNIHSCKVNVSSSLNYYGGFYDIGEFNLYGGSVDATCNSDGYGLCDISSLKIWGGEMKAEGKGAVFGIQSYSVTNVTVYGGKLWVKNADSKALDPSARLTFTKDAGYTTGKIETSDDGENWDEYTDEGKPETKYVRVGY